MAQDQDQQENFPEFIIDRLLQPNNRNLYFKFNEVCEVLKNTNTQIKIEEIQTSKEWLPFAQTVIRMETLVKPQCAAQILIEKFQEWETVKSTKLISEEQVNIDNISNDWLRSFGYRRTEKYPGFEFISKSLSELTIDENDFRKYVKAYSAWNNDHQIFNYNDYMRLKLIRGEEEEYFDDPAEANLYWLQDQ